MKENEIKVAMAKAKHNEKFKKQSGLEALKEYRNQQIGVNVHADDYLDIIEEELKEKDELAQALSIITCENGELLKYKKALEIVKEYGLISSFFTYNKTYETYQVNLSFYDDIKLMSKEEYNLLKEVLL